jgi:hypothetical protein
LIGDYIAEIKNGNKKGFCLNSRSLAFDLEKIITHPKKIFPTSFPSHSRSRPPTP